MNCVEQMREVGRDRWARRNIFTDGPAVRPYLFIAS
jgi:hypothetical protein